MKERDNNTLRGVVQKGEREVRVKNEENQHLRWLLQEKDCAIHQLQQKQQFAPSSYTCLVSGPGLQSTTVNHPTRVVVELRNSSGRSCSLKLNVTASLSYSPLPHKPHPLVLVGGHGPRRLPNRLLPYSLFSMLQ